MNAALPRRPWRRSMNASRPYPLAVAAALCLGAYPGMQTADGAARKEAPLPAVYAVAETEPVRSRGDAADDPAIWIHPSDATHSLILGTDKRKGLAVYDLTGREVQFLARGRLNNVDLRQEILLDGGAVTLAVATNRTEHTMDVFGISAQGEVNLLRAQPLDIDDPYGVCIHRDSHGNAHAFVNGSDGAYEMWRLTAGGAWSVERTDRFRVASKPEGCVVDDTAGIAYIGEEERGIWKMPARPGGFAEATLLDSVENGRLVADVEGLDIYRPARGNALLVASSQGDDTFAFYDLGNDSYLGSIRVADNPGGGIDGAEDTDGLAASSVNLGPGFEAGLLVVQDGHNRRPRARQNFKLIPWSSVARALNLPAVERTE